MDKLADNKTAEWSRYDLIAIVSIACLAIALRFPTLSLQELRLDETFTWQLSHLSVWEIICRSAHDVHPPGHYLILKGWASVFGTSVAACRGLSALLGTLASVAAYLLMRELACVARVAQTSEPLNLAQVLTRHERTIASFVAYAAAIHFLQVEHSRDIRMYAQGMLLATLSAW